MIVVEAGKFVVNEGSHLAGMLDMRLPNAFTWGEVSLLAARIDAINDEYPRWDDLTEWSEG